MNTELNWMDTELAKRPGATVQWHPDWEVQVYRVGGKMMGMRGEYKDGRPLLTLKLSPERGDFLRREFEYIIPGYYSNKTHYNSIFLDSEVQDSFISELLAESYALVLASLTKKARQEIEASQP